MIHHYILSSLCHLFSFLDCSTVHTSRYFLSYISQTRRNDNLSWTSDYVNDKLDLHSRKLMSRYYEWFSLRIDRTWFELEWNSPVLLNIIPASTRIDYSLKVDHVLWWECGKSLIRTIHITINANCQKFGKLGKK